MDRQKLVQLIKFAVENGISCIEIEPKRRGTTPSRLLNGKKLIENCTESKIQELHKSVTKILNEKEEQPQTMAENSIAKDQDKIAILEKQVANLITENKHMRTIIVDIQKQLNMLRHGKTKIALPIKEKPIETGKSILGYTMQIRGKYWYAGKNISGKTKWLYVGKDKTKAVEKIKAYLEKHRTLL